jgi:hypothetical protein
LRNITDNTDHHRELVQEGGLQQVPCLLIESKEGDKQWLYEPAGIIRYLRHQVTSIEA